MEVSLNIFWLTGIMILAVTIGYFIGRGERKSLTAEAVEGTDLEGADKPERNRRNGRRVFMGKTIASPVDGKVHYFCEGGCKGAMIIPEQGKIYAPVSGKIIKVFPMGNAFLIRTEEQSELLIRVGRPHPDELCSMYFRARVVQNEIINKGKLLLEFDMEGLVAAGEEIYVTVCPEEEDILVTEKEFVKVGEELLTIYENTQT